MKYDEYLRATAPMSEKEFNEIANTLPEVSFDEVKKSFNDGLYDTDSQYDLALIIINAILMRYTHHAYVDDLDLECKYVYIGDIESVKELVDIKIAFSQTDWTIASNTVEEIEEAEKIKAEESARDRCLKVINNLPTQTLEEIIKGL